MPQRVKNGIFRYKLRFEPRKNSMSWVCHVNASILGSRLAKLHPPISFLFSKHVSYWNSSGLQSFTLWSKDLTLWGVLLLQSDNLWLQFMTLGMVNHHRLIHSDYSIHFCRSHLSCGLFWTEPQPTQTFKPNFSGNPDEATNQLMGSSDNWIEFPLLQVSYEKSKSFKFLFQDPRPRLKIEWTACEHDFCSDLFFWPFNALTYSDIRVWIRH